MNSSLIQADNVSIIKSGRVILDHVSLEVGDKDFITIIGPNGAGKSILLKALLGIEPIDSGSITRRQDIRIGYVPQRLHAEPTLPVTVKRFLNLTISCSVEVFDRVVAMTEVRTLLPMQLNTLSGGGDATCLISTCANP